MPGDSFLCCPVLSSSVKILLPCLIIFQHGIQDREQLSQAGGDRQLLRLSSFQSGKIKRFHATFQRVVTNAAM